ncbi:MAG: helix-turn-helix domain-containing protein [Treponemataceae bacterium]
MENKKSDDAQLADVLLSMLPEGVTALDDESDSLAVRQRKKEILDASLRVFSQKGFDGGRTKEIAQEAKTSEATIFKYFPTKRHLMFAVIKPLIETIARPLFMKPIERLLERQKGRPLEETLTFIMIDRWRMFADNERMIALAYMEAYRNPDLVEAMKQMIIPQIHKYLDPLFSAASTSGEIRSDLSPRFLSRSFLSQVLGFILVTRAVPEPFAFGELESDIAATVSLFVRGLAPRDGVHA